MTGMDERLAKVAEVLHAASTTHRRAALATPPYCECRTLAQALAPLLAEWQAEDRGRCEACPFAGCADCPACGCGGTCRNRGQETPRAANRGEVGHGATDHTKAPQIGVQRFEGEA